MPDQDQDRRVAIARCAEAALILFTVAISLAALFGALRSGLLTRPLPPGGTCPHSPEEA